MRIDRHKRLATLEMDFWQDCLDEGWDGSSGESVKEKNKSKPPLKYGVLDRFVKSKFLSMPIFIVKRIAAALCAVALNKNIKEK